MNFLGDKFLEFGDFTKIKCCKCGGFICVADSYGQSGFNYKVRYFCEKCVIPSQN